MALFLTDKGKRKSTQAEAAAEQLVHNVQQMAAVIFVMIELEYTFLQVTTAADVINQPNRVGQTDMYAQMWDICQQTNTRLKLETSIGTYCVQSQHYVRY